MILHLLKLVWNRKKTNLLIVAEIFFSFLVVFALSATAIYLYDRYSDPLGFDYQDVMQIDVARNSKRSWGEWTQEEAGTFRVLLREMNAMDEVVVAAGGSTAPYHGSMDITGWKYDKRDVRAETSRATPEFGEVLGLELVAGRWLTSEDAALDWTPIVIDQDLAHDLMGDADPVGQRVSDDPEDDFRVVGVVREYRRGGEFDQNRNYAFMSANLESEDSRPLELIVARLAPGTTAEFEERMTRKLQALAQGWSFNVKYLDTARDGHLKEHLIPLGAIGLVAGFLLLMVVLGLTGVMWQNVTRRTREIGLRRAIGAHRGRIHRQIVGEVLVTASLGVFVGTLLAIQVPVIGPFTFVPFGVVLPALIGSAILILGLTSLCGLYPGWSATRIRPAEALHYE